MARFADGSKSLAECPRCLGWFPQAQMRLDQNTRRYVCADDWDRKDVVGWTPPFDPQAIRWSQPKTPGGTIDTPYVPSWDPYLVSGD